MTATVETPAQVNATGTRLRLRALGAMGHSDRRLARALATPEWLVTRIVTGKTRVVPPALRADVCRLYDLWWCLKPPERTPAERRAAAVARERAQRGRWCTPMGCDDELLDVPGYRPRTPWRPAAGTGVADDPYPLGRRRPA